MNVVTDYQADLWSSKLLLIYATRVARRLLLARSCEADHPVLEVEENLIQMARSRLQEFLMVTFPGQFEKVRPTVITMIRRMAINKIMDSEEREETKKALVEAVWTMPTEDIIPTIH